MLLLTFISITFVTASSVTVSTWASDIHKISSVLIFSSVVSSLDLCSSRNLLQTATRVDASGGARRLRVRCSRFAVFKSPAANYLFWFRSGWSRNLDSRQSCTFRRAVRAAPEGELGFVSFPQTVHERSLAGTSADSELQCSRWRQPRRRSGDCLPSSAMSSSHLLHSLQNWAAMYNGSPHLLLVCSPAISLFRRAV
jgi:hypothetical protein